MKRLKLWSSFSQKLLKGYYGRAFGKIFNSILRGSFCKPYYGFTKIELLAKFVLAKFVMDLPR